MAVAGRVPEEMGIGPIYAIPKLLKQHGLKVGDIGLWELNEAFACQALYCRDALGIDPDKYNVDGGGVSVGHPYGMTGARLVAHALIEGKRRGVKNVVVTTCAWAVAWGLRACSRLPEIDDSRCMNTALDTASMRKTRPCARPTLTSPRSCLAALWRPSS
jgi:acetyl-CoA acetyltransferase